MPFVQLLVRHHRGRWAIKSGDLQRLFKSRNAAMKAAVDLAKEEAAIRQADAQWLAAAKSHDLEKTVSSWTDDAVIVAPDQPVIRGRKAIHDYVAGAFATPGFSIDWKTDVIVVSRSGDMAYSTGSDTFTFAGAGKKLVTQHSRGVVVWRKQPDGSWKAAVDIWNTEGSAPKH